MFKKEFKVNSQKAMFFGLGLDEKWIKFYIERASKLKFKSMDSEQTISEVLEM